MKFALVVLFALLTSSVCNAQNVVVTGSYSDLNGGQLPDISAKNLMITILDDNGNPLPAKLSRKIQPRQVQASQQLRRDQFTITFESPTTPNRTISMLFDAPGRDPVTIPRILASGRQTVNVVLPERTCCQSAYYFTPISDRREGGFVADGVERRKSVPRPTNVSK